ncbi:MAG: hypothetical protein ACREE3_05605, partial [Stellaceae bacterium]
EPPYPFIHSESSGLQSIFSKAPEALKRLLVIEDRIQDILNARNRAAITETLGNMRNLSRNLAAHTKDIDAILANTADASHALDGAAKSIDRLTGKTETAVNRADQLIASANRLVKHTDKAVEENRPGLKNLTSRGVNQLIRLISNANDLMVKFGRVADELQRNPSRFLFGGHQAGYRPK